MNHNPAIPMFRGLLWAAAASACSGQASDGSSSESSELALGSIVAASSAVAGSQQVLSDAPFSTSLPIPPVLTPTSRDASTDYYELTIRSGLAQMRAGAATPIVGFDGLAPGPTIVATRGRTVQVTQRNEWSESVSVHNHGHKVAADSDGHPVDHIEPGSSKVYTYPNDQSAGTYWYHDHTMDLTGPHVYQGLAGFYLIRDPAEEALQLPTGTHDIPLLIQDKTFNEDNSLSYEHDHFLGFFGDTALVNGVATPYLDVGTSKYRFRVLNGANARPLFLQLQVVGSSGAQPFQVIASDGGLLAAPVELTTLPIAPAERYDIIIDFDQYPVGTRLELITSALFPLGGSFGGNAGGPFGGNAGGPFGGNAGGVGPGRANVPGASGPLGSPFAGASGPGVAGPGFGPGRGSELAGLTQAELAERVPALTQLLQFVVARSEADASAVPPQLANVQRHEAADAVRTTDISFQYDGQDWTMNGLTYDPERIDVTSELDQVYIWSLRNESPLPHPFHKHLSFFNVLDINGQAPPSFASGWKDTVMVPPFGSARIVFKNETFSGTYVFHCHNLEHEDHRMMLQEQVQ